MRAGFAYDVDKASEEAAIDCSAEVEPSRTQQHFAEEVDINTIVRRFGLTGELPTNVPQVLQGDFTNVHDFQSAMNLVVAAREAFMEQPAEVRARVFRALPLSRHSPDRPPLPPPPVEALASPARLPHTLQRQSR